MARFIVKDTEFEKASGRADSLSDRLQSIATDGIHISPAAACVLPRLADRFRFDVIVTARSSKELQTFLTNARKTVSANRELVVDVDPISML
jgi:primosomal protein N'